MSINFKKGILIFGFSRSGSTLIRSLFAKNEQYLVYEIEIHWFLDYWLKYGKNGTSVFEAWFFLENHRKFPSLNRWENINICKDDFFENFNKFKIISSKELFRGIMNMIFKDETSISDRTLVVKYPALIEHEKAVSLLFDKVFLINMVRDPRGAINSYMNRWTSGELLYVIKLWNKSIKQVNDFKNYNLINIKYEDLLINSNIVELELKEFLHDSKLNINTKFKNKIIQFTSTNKGKEELKTLEGFQTGKINSWEDELSNVKIKIIELFCLDGMITLDYKTINLKSYYKIPLMFFKLEHVLKEKKRKLSKFRKNKD